MLSEHQVREKIKEAFDDMKRTRSLFGKLVFHKRFKPSYESFLSALCTVLEHSDEERTEVIENGGEK